MEKVAKFKDRFALALNESGIKQIDLAKRIGISRSLITRYLKGEFEPNNKNILLIAKELNVSPTWLIGFDVDKKFENMELIMSKEESKIKKEILSIINDTHDIVELNKILTMLELLKK